MSRWSRYAQHALDHRGRVGRGDAAEHLAADVLLLAVPAADEDVIALDHVVPDFNPGTEQTDVAEVVLRTSSGTR